MNLCLLVDFGSTNTKVTVFDTDAYAFIGRAQAPTTIEKDINIGLRNAMEALRQSCGIREEDIAERYACSSAAGGLRMVAVGLVPALTLEAAKRAALGAGAKVIAAYGYELDENDIREIEAADADILMLCGGTDGGNKNVILANGMRLAASALTCPILVCGNRAATEKLRTMLESAGKCVYTAANVLPEIDRLEVEPAQEKIREMFVAHIVRAKGLDMAVQYFDQPIIPTPMASLHAAELLADGTADTSGIGSLLVVEVGGATTNIHSVETDRPVTLQTVMRGLPNNRVSRTVEGDLGIRFNAETIRSLVGDEALNARARQIAPTLALSKNAPADYTTFVGSCISYVPESEAEYLLDSTLAAASADMAVERHAGTVSSEYALTGKVTIQRGKNLLQIKNIIGTGGIFKYGRYPRAVLAAALFREDKPWSLKPTAPTCWIDREYILYAVGLLAPIYPDAALHIAKTHLQKVDISDCHAPRALFEADISD